MYSACVQIHVILCMSTQCVREGVHCGVTMETLPDRVPVLPVENYPIPGENATRLGTSGNRIGRNWSQKKLLIPPWLLVGEVILIVSSYDSEVCEAVRTVLQTCPRPWWKCTQQFPPSWLGIVQTLGFWRVCTTFGRCTRCTHSFHRLCTFSCTVCIGYRVTGYKNISATVILVRNIKSKTYFILYKYHYNQYYRM